MSGTIAADSSFRVTQMGEFSEIRQKSSFQGMSPPPSHVALIGLEAAAIARLYQACNDGASLALKKMPPMPVTRFMLPLPPFLEAIMVSDGCGRGNRIKKKAIYRRPPFCLDTNSPVGGPSTKFTSQAPSTVMNNTVPSLVFVHAS